MAAFLVAAALCVSSVPGAESDSATVVQARPDPYQTDVTTLSGYDHRLSGSANLARAAEYVTTRLRQAGVPDIVMLHAPTWGLDTASCFLQVDTFRIPVYGVRPNLTVLPVTPKEGVTGPLLYAGQGAIVEYGARSPEGAIVVLEYDCADNWKRAFSLGARAVVFIGSGDERTGEAKHVPLPANLPRFYVSLCDAERAELRRDRSRAVLVSHESWRAISTRSIVARIPGTDPGFSALGNGPEAIVLSAWLDSYGIVPRRSPGARSAANVAALLSAARHFMANRPRRDVVLMFLDGSSFYHQGARAVYSVLAETGKVSRRRHEEHQEELAFRQRMLEALPSAPGAMEGPTAVVTALHHLLEDHAEYLRTDQNQMLLRLRVVERGEVPVDSALLGEQRSLQERIRELDNAASALQGNRLSMIDSELYAHLRAATGALPGEAVRNSALLEVAREERDAYRRELKAVDDEVAALRRPDSLTANRRAELEGMVRRWDLVRRQLADRELDGIDQEMYASLYASARNAVELRLAELSALAEIDQEEQALRKMLAESWIALHVEFNFGGDGSMWGPVIGNNSQEPFKTSDPNGDNPGYYSLLLKVFRRAARAAPDLRALNRDMLRDPLRAQQFVPGNFASNGMVAGTFGIYNLSLMTCADGRERDGQPSDVLAHLNWRRIREQSREACRLLGLLADDEGLALKRVFADLSHAEYPKWENNKSSGNYAGIQVTGGLAEDRPARDAVLALWQGREWATLSARRSLPGFERYMLERIDGNGRFGMRGVRKDYFSGANQCAVLGACFDSLGRVTEITTLSTMGSRKRTNLFPGTGHVVAYPVMGDQASIGRLLVMEATSNAPFRDNRMLSGVAEGFAFYYIHLLETAQRIKVFQPKGPVLLGPSSTTHPYGEGFDIDRLGAVPPVDQVTAQNLWNLNEVRLSMLRSRSVSDARLEVVHGRAKRLIEKAAESRRLSDRVSLLAQSTALSRAVYDPVRETMDDLVRAVVILLLLAIPFAFALERLLVSAANIYVRIGGFAVGFIVTFWLLYMMHPGFSIASAPSMVFLAFVIILLASMVIYIMARKFRSELMAFQGRSSKVHSVEISRMGTLIVAMSMGMSTMRRRPIRTVLTTLTVLMLTFTILSFASFGTSFGVRSFYVGPISEDIPATFLVKDINYRALSEDLLRLFHARAGEGGMFSAIWWLTNRSSADKPVSVSRRAGQETVFVEGVLGVSPGEVSRWPALAGVLGLTGEDGSLGERDVFLPLSVVRRLDVQPGDSVLVNGLALRFAGTFDGGGLQRLRHLDEQSIVPVNFLDPAFQQEKQDEAVRRLTTELVQRDFARLNASQVAIASDDVVSDLGGQVFVIAKYGEGDGALSREGDRLAEIAGLPVWCRTSDGVERRVATRVAAVSGGLGLFVPLLLGGLIIFGTLLGSITDREREIYTFSALGLGPSHIGFLFVAEAFVYAIVGGMGGQLLAQMFAALATHLAGLGYIDQPDINFSSANSLSAIGIVMVTVLVSAVYPAIKASRSANPGVQRNWQMPLPEGDELSMVFPFTVSAYDITGVVSFLAEHFRSHEDAGLGCFASRSVRISRDAEEGVLQLTASVSLAPFDLGISQDFRLTAVASEIPGVDEVMIRGRRTSGARTDWIRANRVFMHELRRQFLLWRTLSAENIEHYRMQTLQALGEAAESSTEAADKV